MKILLIYTVIILASWGVVHAQLAGTFSASNFEVVNRHISIDKSKGKSVVHLDGSEGAGVAWLKNTSLSTGSIEFDVKGKDVMQQSFVGIAFHGTSDSAYDCIYFRPFNFNATNTTAKNHSVQYISMPQYDWSYLREKFPGKYESVLTNPIDPNIGFHAKIVIDTNGIAVFVNGDDKPSLNVKPLNNYLRGRIGFWVGNYSDGDFSNLTIKQN